MKKVINWQKKSQTRIKSPKLVKKSQKLVSKKSQTSEKMSQSSEKSDKLVKKVTN